MAEHEIMTIEEVAELLRVSERTIYDWAQKGDIPAGKIGTAWRFRRSEVNRWIDERLGGKKAAPAREAVSVRAVLAPEQVLLLDQATKEEVLDLLAARLSSLPGVPDHETVIREIHEREALMSTGIGLGVGVPHVRLPGVADVVMAVAVCHQPISAYASLDDEPVRIVCMILANADQHAKYIKVLAGVSRKVKDARVRERLLAAATPAAVYEILCEES